MSTATLVKQAVNNSTTTGLKAIGDRLFARWFSQLVYAQIWEDPDVDIAALQLQPGKRVLTIASGGCNALAYLSCQPAEVHAVDLNDTHLAMLALKKAAFAELPDYATLLDFLGDANQRQNAHRYRRYLAAALPVSARQYWEQRNLWGTPRYALFTCHAYRHGLLGRFIGVSHTLARLLGGNLARLAEAGTLDEQKQLFERHLAPVFRHPLLRFLCHRESVLYSMGATCQHYSRRACAAWPATSRWTKTPTPSKPSPDVTTPATSAHCHATCSKPTTPPSASSWPHCICITSR